MSEINNEDLAKKLEAIESMLNRILPKPQMDPKQMEQMQKVQENQFRIKQIAKEKNDEVKKRCDERLFTEIFANAKISDRWKSLVKKCIMKTAPVHHSLLIPQYLDALKVDPETQDLTLFQFGVLNNSLENVSPEQMGITREEYVDLIENEVLPLMEIYKGRFKSILEEITLQVDAEFKTKIAEQMISRGKIAKAQA